jgi:hypothetical protein
MSLLDLIQARQAGRRDVAMSGFLPFGSRQPPSNPSKIIDVGVRTRSMPRPASPLIAWRAQMSPVLLLLLLFDIQRAYQIN